MDENVTELRKHRNQIAILRPNHHLSITLKKIPPISVNTLYSFFRGRKILTKSGRNWREKVDPILTAINATYDEKVSVEIQCFPASARSYDLDNCAKAIIDALQRNGILVNDLQVYRLEMIKHDKNPLAPGGEIWIDIQPYNDGEVR